MAFLQMTQCPICDASDQHDEDCLLKGKLHIFSAKKGECVDWPATLKANGIRMAGVTHEPLTTTERLMLANQMTMMVALGEIIACLPEDDAEDDENLPSILRTLQNGLAATQQHLDLNTESDVK